MMFLFFCGLVGYTCGNAIGYAFEKKKPLDGAIAVATLVVLLMYAATVVPK